MRTKRDRKGKVGYMSISVSPQGAVFSKSNPEYMWAKAEAERRGVALAQVIRDALRAYRKLEPNCAPMPSAAQEGLPVSF